MVHLHHQLYLPVLPPPAGLRHRGAPPQDPRPQAGLRKGEPLIVKTIFTVVGSLFQTKLQIWFTAPRCSWWPYTEPTQPHVILELVFRAMPARTLVLHTSQFGALPLGQYIRTFYTLFERLYSLIVTISFQFETINPIVIPHPLSHYPAQSSLPSVSQDTDHI